MFSKFAVILASSPHAAKLAAPYRWEERVVETNSCRASRMQDALIRGFGRRSKHAGVLQIAA
jgi:hypothetical protein